MLRRKSFAKFFGFMVVFWIVGEILLGFVRSPFADTYTGNVYLVDVTKGYKQLKPLNAQVSLDIIDKGFIYDRVEHVSKAALRINFTGDGSADLKKLGIDPLLINSENPHGGLCNVRTSEARKHASFFAGMKTELNDLEMRYISAHDMKFHNNMRDDPDCKSVHIGTVRFDNVQIAIDSLSDSYFIFADLKRDSHIGFVQRMIMKLRFSPEKDWPKFLAIN